MSRSKHLGGLLQIGLVVGFLRFIIVSPVLFSLMLLAVGGHPQFQVIAIPGYPLRNHG
jgi:hypothetical protein